jgi:hypothetical protein
MDAVAEAILDVGLGRRSAPTALNFVHPRPITWTLMINSIREALVAQNYLDVTALPLISFGEWVARLEEHAKDEDLTKIVGAPDSRRPTCIDVARLFSLLLSFSISSGGYPQIMQVS